MIGQAKQSNEDLLGKLSRQFIEQLVMMAAVPVAGPGHPGRATGQVRLRGSQGELVNITDPTQGELLGATQPARRSAPAWLRSTGP